MSTIEATIGVTGEWRIREDSADPSAAWRFLEETRSTAALNQTYRNVVGWLLVVCLGYAVIDLGEHFAPRFWALWILGAAAACSLLWLLPFALQQRSQAAVHRQWRRWGLAEAMSVRIQLTPERLEWTVGDVHGWAGWAAISEVVPAGGHWLLWVQGRPLRLPRRFFADSGSERDFIGAALARMSDAARERSSGAARFAGRL